MSKPGSSSHLISTTVKELIWGEQEGAFDDPVGRSIKRACDLGVADEKIMEMALSRVRRLRMKEARGELDPFREPRLHAGELIVARSRGGTEIRIPAQSTRAGVLFLGNTGSGKSNLLFVFLPQLAATGCHFWVVDNYKKQMRNLRPICRGVGADLIVLRPEGYKVNSLHPGPIPPRLHLPRAVDVLVRTLALPGRSRSVLTQGCYHLYDKFNVWEGGREAPCYFDLWEWVRSTSGLNPPAREAILDRLGALLVEMTPQSAAYRVPWSPIDLADFNICWELRGTSETVKQAILEPLLFSVFQHEVDKAVPNAPLRLFVALDDSQRLFDSGRTSSGELATMEELAGLVRGTGVGIGVSVQTTIGLSRRLTANLATRFVGRLGSHEDYTRAGSDMGLNRAQIEWAKANLRPGLFLIQRADCDWREPCVAQVPHVPINELMSDDEVAESVQALDHLKTIPAEEYADWKPHYVLHIRTSREEDARETTNDTPANPPLRKDELDYLVSIAKEPFLKVTDRDEVLGLAKSKGNQLRGALIKKGLLNAVAINPGGRGRRFQLLELTKAGVEQLSAFGVSIPDGRGRGGLRHQFWASEVAGWLRGKKLTPVIEDESSGVRVDVAVVTLRGSHVAIEVETSPGHELENIRKDLGAGFEEVVCLVGSAELARSLEARVLQELNRSEIPCVKVGCFRDYQDLLDRLVS